MEFIRKQPGVRVFYLGAAAASLPAVLLAKNGGTFASPSNLPTFMGHGWVALTLSMSDTDTLGPLAWSFAGVNFISQPHDVVIAMGQGDVDQAALERAFRDLAAGFRVGIPLSELVQRPLFQFLTSLR